MIAVGFRVKSGFAIAVALERTRFGAERRCSDGSST